MFKRGMTFATFLLFCLSVSWAQDIRLFQKPPKIAVAAASMIEKGYNLGVSVQNMSASIDSSESFKTLKATFHSNAEEIKNTEGELEIKRYNIESMRNSRSRTSQAIKYRLLDSLTQLVTLDSLSIVKIMNQIQVSESINKFLEARINTLKDTLSKRNAEAEEDTEVNHLREDIRKINGYVKVLKDSLETLRKSDSSQNPNFSDTLRDPRFKDYKKQKEGLDSLSVYLQEKMIKLQLINMKLRSNIGNQEFQNTREKLYGSDQPMRIGGDLVIPLSGSNNANYLSPALTANYRKRLFLKRFHPGDLMRQGDISLTIQPPFTSNDTNMLITNILSSGPDGSFQVSQKYGLVTPDLDWWVGGNINMNWLNSRAFQNSTLSSFAYLSCGYVGAVRWGPGVFLYQYEYRRITGERTSLLSSELHKSMSGNIIIGLDMGTYQLQLKYLLHSNKPKKDNQNLEIRTGLTFSPF